MNTILTVSEFSKKDGIKVLRADGYTKVYQVYQILSCLTKNHGRVALKDKYYVPELRMIVSAAGERAKELKVDKYNNIKFRYNLPCTLPNGHKTNRPFTVSVRKEDAMKEMFDVFH